MRYQVCLRGSSGGNELPLEERKISHIDVSVTSSHLAGVFKESKLWEVHPEGPAGGPHAAGAEVSPPPSGKRTMTHF